MDLFLDTNAQSPSDSLQRVQLFVTTWTAARQTSLLLLLSRFSRVRLCATPQMAAHQAPPSWDFLGKSTIAGCHCLLRQTSLSTTISQSLLKLMSIELVMPSNHLILWNPIVFPSSIFPSIRLFSNESVLCIKWPKYWSFSFSISPSNEHPGLISFRTDWLDLLAVQGTLKSLLQHHSSKASILLRSACFIFQLSNPYMTTGKTIALTRWTFVGKIMSMFFNMLSRLLITFIPRSKRLLISWLSHHLH